ncbi:phosphonoacetaldehyde hydrolase [Klebsiella pneumoniae]|uniref:Phosphonoacetaldehyde hydrolase n=1 Tax=Klebsiella pneumoniae TaxID=573 RepID=A0A378FQQ0_KLEPN|nr:phosphonoacetaldehyde hydrolase [Klebsiella pneumoniae]
MRSTPRLCRCKSLRLSIFPHRLPAVVDTIAALRAKGLKIGSCSGYPRPVMEKLVPAAAAQGYAPDHWVATDDLAAGGRPGPWMALQNVITLGIDDVAHCVKVDDAAPGISEGLHAGMWSVGLAVSGNEFGRYLGGVPGDVERGNRHPPRAGGRQTVCRRGALCG